MGRRISKEFLHPSILEGVNNKIGNLDSLETDAKGNMVQAINELVEKLDNSAEIENGKELIANAVGEPLTAEESFDEMSNDINGLLSTFKTNMMNNGITVQSGDKFKQLIDKIATMVEEGSGKGIQYASGDAIVNVSEGGIAVKNEADNMSDSMYLAKITDLGFKPHICVCVCDLDGNGRYIITSVYTEDSGMFFTNQTGSVQYGVYKPTESLYVSNDEITMPFKSDFFGSDKYTKYYAIGVGEEDTTLRDSLASILEDEGVSVTEEDDMADLITKVDEEFDNKNTEMENLIPQYIAGDSTCIINFPINGSVAFDISGKEPQIDYLCLFKGSVKLNCNIYSASANEYWDNYFLLVLEDSLGNEVFSDTVAYESPYENSARSLEYSKTIENINVGYRIRLYAYGVRVGNANTEENRQYGSSLKVNYVNIYGDKVN